MKCTGDIGHFLSFLPFCDLEILSSTPDSIRMFWLQVTDSLDSRVLRGKEIHFLHGKPQAVTALYVRALLLTLYFSWLCLLLADTLCGHKLAAAILGISSTLDNVQQKNRGQLFLVSLIKNEK